MLKSPPYVSYADRVAALVIAKSVVIWRKQGTRSDAVVARLLHDLMDKLACRAEVNDPLAELAPSVLGQEEADERLASARRQLQRDVRRVHVGALVRPEDVGLMRPEMRDISVSLQRAKQTLGILHGPTRRDAPSKRLPSALTHRGSPNVPRVANNPRLIGISTDSNEHGCSESSSLLSQARSCPSLARLALACRAACEEGFNEVARHAVEARRPRSA
jgi:hypothetical protein